MNHISVVDDDASVRSATIDLLNSAGFDCEAFDSAEAYLQSNRMAQTSCLILDIKMPGLDAWDGPGCMGVAAAAGCVRVLHSHRFHYRVSRSVDSPAGHRVRSDLLSA